MSDRKVEFVYVSVTGALNARCFRPGCVVSTHLQAAMPAALTRSTRLATINHDPCWGTAVNKLLKEERDAFTSDGNV